MTGLQGSFFAPLALSYILAIMASLLVALTVTPALAYLLFGKGVKHSDEAFLQRWLKHGYVRILGFVARWPRLLIGLVLVICILAATRLQYFGGGFLPEFREGHFVLQVSAAPGTSLEEMLRLGTLISKKLLSNTNIATVEQQVGRAEQGEDTFPPSRSEFHVELQPVQGEEQGKIADDISRVAVRSADLSGRSLERNHRGRNGSYRCEHLR